MMMDIYNQSFDYYHTRSHPADPLVRIIFESFYRYLSSNDNPNYRRWASRGGQKEFEELACIAADAVEDTVSQIRTDHEQELDELSGQIEDLLLEIEILKEHDERN